MFYITVRENKRFYSSFSTSCTYKSSIIKLILLLFRQVLFCFVFKTFLFSSYYILEHENEIFVLTFVLIAQK